MDNFWLYIAVKYGLPAFVFLVAGYVLGIVSIMRQAGLSRETGLESLRKAWVICFVGLSFTLATVHVWTSVFTYVFFLFGAGLWMLEPGSATARRKCTRRAALPSSRNLHPVFSRPSARDS